VTTQGARLAARMLSVGLVSNLCTANIENVIMLRDLAYQYLEPIGRIGCLFATGYLLGQLSRKRKHG